MLLTGVLAMQLLTTTFAQNATVPTTMVATDCGGKNVSPALHWTGVPQGTKSFAMIVHDPDAPGADGFYHWVFYDLPPTKTALAAGESIASNQSGRNGTGSTGYYGPCPPPGKTHHYNFTLYALDVPSIGATEPLDAHGLQARLAHHVLATATLTGLFSTR